MTTESLPDPTQPAPSYRFLQLALVLNGFAYLFIIAILTWANIMEETGSLIRWAIQCVPLLLVLPGLLSSNYRAYSWLCFIVILYFIPSVLKVMSPQGNWSDTLMLLACLTIFVAGAFSSRWLQRSTPIQREDHHE